MTKEQLINRLLTEWKTHGKIIVSVDFDDTIFPFRHATQEECDKRIELLKQVKSTGAYIIIHTACNTDRFADIETYCDNKKLPIDGINVTPPSLDLPYGRPGSKIYYNINLCDRSGLNEAMNILESALYQYRGHLEQEKLGKLGDIA